MADSTIDPANERSARPVVLITGGAGNIGSALVRALQSEYRVISLDIDESKQAEFSETFDLTDPDSVRTAIGRVAQVHGQKIAAVVHLAAYFDFTGEHSPLYDKVNVQGTRNLLDALDQVEVERFIYSSTMLVHRPGGPGDRIDETAPIEPKWAYPESKANTEAVIAEYADRVPVTVLRLAGLYDETHCVPTLAHQIARIYETTLKSHLYSGDPDAGQAFLHQEDMVDAFTRCIRRRNELPGNSAILIGEQDSESYQALQDRLGELIHGREHWQTLSVPKPLAKMGAWAQEKAEPVVPDQIDNGEKPFIRPFMIDMASDHYQLDISRARRYLGWDPRHRLRDSLGALVANLKADPHGWYQANGITPPD
ncbi:MAG: NAD(P)-dependent oxidoreductase [Pseudomonas sp.]|nr:NAD(P)-dependent oxidoreductase [Pseudomonas sp.]